MEIHQNQTNRVIVVGSGIAGSLVAKSLQFTADVTVIDSKEYFEISWASLRAMVEPPFAERSVIYHKDYLINGFILTSSAIHITDYEVLTKEWRLGPYDYLVIATDHSDPLPYARNDRLKQFEQDNEKIKEASSILIIGGGPTGVEFASEIAVDYPKKKVTLIYIGSRLLEFIGPKAFQKILNWLKGKRVEVRLGQSIDMNSGSQESDEYVTSTGETVKADCFFLCFGKPVGSE